MERLERIKALRESLEDWRERREIDDKRDEKIFAPWKAFLEMKKAGEKAGERLAERQSVWAAMQQDYKRNVRKLAPASLTQALADFAAEKELVCGKFPARAELVGKALLRLEELHYVERDIEADITAIRVELGGALSPEIAAANAAEKAQRQAAREAAQRANSRKSETPPNCGELIPDEGWARERQLHPAS